MIYLIVYFFGVISAVSGPLPYTMQQCIESLEVLELPVELQATATCFQSDIKPELGVLTEEQQQIIIEWSYKTDSEDERSNRNVLLLNSISIVIYKFNIRIRSDK